MVISMDILNFFSCFLLHCLPSFVFGLSITQSYPQLKFFQDISYPEVRELTEGDGG